MYTVQVTASGGGPTHDVCKVHNLQEATGVVKLLDELCKHWVEIPSLKARESWPLYVQHLEGSDVYARGENIIFSYADEWEELGTEAWEKLEAV